MMNRKRCKLATVGGVLLYSGILTCVQADPRPAAFDRDIWGPLAPLVNQKEPERRIAQNVNQGDDPNELIDTLILQDLFPEDVPPPEVAEPVEPQPQPQPQWQPEPQPEPEPLPEPQPAPEPRRPEDPWAQPPRTEPPPEPRTPQPPRAEPPPDPWAPQAPPPPPPPSREPRFPADPWAPDTRPDPWAPAPRLADPWAPQAGRWTWSTFFATAFADSKGELYTGHLSAERLVWYNWSFALQPFAGIGAGRNDSTGVFGLDTILKYPLYVSGPARFNLEGGTGFQQSGPKSWPDDGTHYNFRGLLGAGLEFDTARFQRLLFGARWLHVTNLGLDGDKNPKVDNLMLYGGWQWHF